MTVLDIQSSIYGSGTSPYPAGYDIVFNHSAKICGEPPFLGLADVLR